MLAGVAAELLELIYRIGVMVRHHAVLAHIAKHLRRGTGVRVVLARAVGVTLSRGVHVRLLVELAVAHLSRVAVFLHRVEVLVRGGASEAGVEGEGGGVGVGVLRVRAVELH